MDKGEFPVDPEMDAHYREIGRAISRWAEIEEELLHIVRLVLSCSPRAAAVVFQRTPTLDGRIQLTDELLKTIFPQPSATPGSHHHPGYKIWMELQTELRKETPIRNRLAHQPVRLRSDDLAEGEVGPLLVATMTSRADVLRYGAEEKPLRIDEIRAHTQRVMELPERLLAFQSGPLATRLQELSSR